MASRFIASVYPIEMKAERAIYGGIFRLPAAKKGDKPVIYEVKDHVQVDTLPWIMAPEGARRQSQTKIKIDATDIARDIIREWTTTVLGQNSNCHPGIWLIRDSIALYNDDGSPQMDALGKQEHRPAEREEREQMFEEDLAENLQAQANWADYCITMGDIMGENIKAVQFIPEYAKILCRYYGRDRRWLYALKDGDVKTCLYCKKSIPSDSIKCQFCHEIVDREGYIRLHPSPEPIAQAATPTPPITPKTPIAPPPIPAPEAEDEEEGIMVVPNRTKNK